MGHPGSSGAAGRRDSCGVLLALAFAALAPAAGCGNDRPVQSGTGGAAGASPSGTAGDGATGGIAGRGGASGRGVGANGASGAGGTGGTGGSGGATPSEGGVAACPDAPPTGACAFESQVCPYPSESCLCNQGQWKCLSCPASRPTVGDACPVDDYRRWFYCLYATLTCSCGAEPPHARWNCGACPQAHPTTGDACGNAYFECRYSNDTCICDPNGVWRCATARCSSNPTCATPGRYTCAYPDLAQTCACGTQDSQPVCSCPAAAPTDGSTCVRDLANFTPGSCVYGNVNCMCNVTAPHAWSCTVPPCPTNQPNVGSACGATLTCNYGGALCTCDGTIWSCS